MDPKNRSTKPSTQGKAEASNEIPPINMNGYQNPFLGHTIPQGSSYHNNSQNVYAIFPFLGHPFPNTTHFHIGPTMGSFVPIPDQGGQTPTNASYYMPQPCVGSPNSLPFTYNQHVVIYQQSGQNISNHTSNGDPMNPSHPVSTQPRESKTQTEYANSNTIPTPHTTVPQNPTYGHSFQTMYANNPIPSPSTPMSQSTTHFHIGPTMGYFVPIPDQGGETPTNASVDSPYSPPFTYNQHVVVYQQFGQTISNHTSNANHMNPNDPVPTQPQDNKTKANEGRPSKGNTLKKRGRTNGLGSEEVDSRNTPHFAGSQQGGQSVADLLQEVKDFDVRAGNLWDHSDPKGANLRGKGKPSKPAAHRGVD